VSSADALTRRLCLFCEADLAGAKSREDTVPQWLQGELQIAADMIQPTLTSPQGVHLKQRTHPVDQLLTGGICRDCNNGWMSRLETQTQPILRAVMHSRRDIATLTRAERQTLSRWAVKTAFVLDAGGLEPRVPQEQSRQVYSNAPHLPPNIYVFARQQARTQAFYYFEDASWSHAALSESAAERVKTQSYKIALQFADLLLFVVSWPLVNWGIRVEKDQLMKLWPTTAVVKQYVHPQPMESTASDRACLRYATSISVVPKAGAEGRAEGNR
jgi:hypothetical protein